MIIWQSNWGVSRLNGDSVTFSGPQSQADRHNTLSHTHTERDRGVPFCGRRGKDLWRGFFIHSACILNKKSTKKTWQVQSKSACTCIMSTHTHAHSAQCVCVYIIYAYVSTIYSLCVCLVKPATQWQRPHKEHFTQSSPGAANLTSLRLKVYHNHWEIKIDKYVYIYI